MDTNVNKKSSVLEIIERTEPASLPTIPQVANRFKKLFKTIHGGGQKVEAFFESEKFHFMKMINESEKLKKCTKMSLYGCFLDVAVNGLSFDPSFKHLYLVPFSTNVGTRQKEKWESRAQLQISGYGELVLRIKQGQIKYVDNPILVYNGDVFKFGTKDGKAFVDHETSIPRKSKEIIACYIRITRTDDTIDFKVVTQEDMDRFKAYAKKDKEGNLSKAWTDGEGGMWQSKCIKHAFKNYPKIRTGEFSELQTQTVDEEPMLVAPATMNVPERIDYNPEDEFTDYEENKNGVTKPSDEKPASEKIGDDDFVDDKTKHKEGIVNKEDDDF